MLTDSNTIYAEGYQPGCIGRITELHGLYYSQCWGVGADWEIIVAREFCDFCEQYNTEHDLLVTAIADNRLIGSVAIVGDAGSSDHTDGARLRWFIVDPAYQGRGIVDTLRPIRTEILSSRGAQPLYPPKACKTRVFHGCKPSNENYLSGCNISISCIAAMFA